ncbi:unnamed protein product, partial [Heterosigma akashiwo]
GAGRGPPAKKAKLTGAATSSDGASLKAEESTPRQAAAAGISARRKDPAACKTVEDCLELGADVLKEELSRRGVKCGGTLQERAWRFFSIKGVPDDQIDKKLKAKATKAPNKENTKKKSSI